VPHSILTLKCSACVVLDRAVGGWESGTSALKVLSVLPELLPCGVGVGQCDNCGKCCDGLHVDELVDNE
jgi:hypothetical protein